MCKDEIHTKITVLMCSSSRTGGDSIGNKVIGLPFLRSPVKREWICEKAMIKNTEKEKSRFHKPNLVFTNSV